MMVNTSSRILDLTTTCLSMPFVVDVFPFVLCLFTFPTQFAEFMQVAKGRSSREFWANDAAVMGGFMGDDSDDPDSEDSSSGRQEKIKKKKKETALGADSAGGMSDLDFLRAKQTNDFSDSDEDGSEDEETEGSAGSSPQLGSKRKDRGNSIKEASLSLDSDVDDDDDDLQPPSKKPKISESGKNAAAASTADPDRSKPFGELLLSCL